MRKIVITGAPGTGKTTIMNQLKKGGYNCVEEISREIIAEEIINGGDCLPWRNLIKFSEKIFTLRESQFVNCTKNISFFDRGLIDVYAYMKTDKIEIPQYFIDSIKEKKYENLVFYTPIWEDIFSNDEERKEDIDQAKVIEENIKNSYLKFGYNLIEIPKGTISERVNFILSKL